MFKPTAVALGVSVLLSGCKLMGEDAICTPDTAVPLAQAAVTAASSEDRKVIVLPVDMEYEDSAQKRMKSSMRNSLESQVISTGTQLVDRKLANKLKSEIKLAEQSGRYNTKGVPIADYAVLTEITNSDLSASFSESYTYKTKKGETKRVPSKCSFTVDVKAIVKVVSLPDMALVKRIEISGDESATSETRDSRCPISPASYKGMATKAAAEAVEYSGDIKELLAAQASVLELRQCETGSMVKIGVGSDKNVQPNDEVSFSTIMKNASGEKETFAVGEGEVVNNPQHGIKPKYSWVNIDEETALKLHIGDAAKIVPSTCQNLFDLQCHTKNMMETAGL
ncbi:MULTISPECIES: hypothetical protein [Vibrio]|uniref:Uncharacterized protein n=1 Tax=Vibrio ostreae TaxID=2841925 RepID=A0A975U960_9VIBR|nr:MULTISPECIES: hypothetical protein [Vibrio]QXO17225.1 hypothetical protein KNV97_17760 [Vibrio ostreae]WGY48448.1 hypothetical protein J0X00_12815 [Vibrio sp. ABG19]